MVYLAPWLAQDMSWDDGKAETRAQLTRPVRMEQPQLRTMVAQQTPPTPAEHPCQGPMSFRYHSEAAHPMVQDTACTADHCEIEWSGPCIVRIWLVSEGQVQ